MGIEELEREYHEAKYERDNALVMVNLAVDSPREFTDRECAAYSEVHRLACLRYNAAKRAYFAALDERSIY